MMRVRIWHFFGGWRGIKVRCHVIDADKGIGGGVLVMTEVYARRRGGAHIVVVDVKSILILK